MSGEDLVVASGGLLLPAVERLGLAAILSCWWVIALFTCNNNLNLEVHSRCRFHG